MRFLWTTYWSFGWPLPSVMIGAGATRVSVMGEFGAERKGNWGARVSGGGAEIFIAGLGGSAHLGVAGGGGDATELLPAMGGGRWSSPSREMSWRGKLGQAAGGLGLLGWCWGLPRWAVGGLPRPGKLGKVFLLLFFFCFHFLFSFSILYSVLNSIQIILYPAGNLYFENFITK
jgi:hypothetical protein